MCSNYINAREDNNINMFAKFRFIYKAFVQS
jgi:hypothetical protein